MSPLFKLPTPFLPNYKYGPNALSNTYSPPASAAIMRIAEVSDRALAPEAKSTYDARFCNYDWTAYAQ
jgi:hypothetical protein